jgi:hypothetical protein
VSYIGHGGIHFWADENVLNVSDVASLPPPSAAVPGSFNELPERLLHFPYFDSLGEALLKADGRGAISAFSRSGLSVNQPANRFHKLLLDALLQRGHSRLGDAVLEAQSGYESDSYPELLTMYHLLGDPALRIR